MKKLKIFESKEYVVWGCDKDHTEEIILMSKFDGKPITDEQQANNLKKLLEDKYGCYNTRIQTVDLSDGNIGNDFTNTLNNSPINENKWVKKKPNGKWGIISAKTGKFWDADYDTQEDAEDGFKAYQANKHG